MRAGERICGGERDNDKLFLLQTIGRVGPERRHGRRKFLDDLLFGDQSNIGRANQLLTVLGNCEKGRWVFGEERVRVVSSVVGKVHRSELKNVLRPLVG